MQMWVQAVPLCEPSDERSRARTSGAVREKTRVRGGVNMDQRPASWRWPPIFLATHSNVGDFRRYSLSETFQNRLNVKVFVAQGGLLGPLSSGRVGKEVSWWWKKRDTRICVAFRDELVHRLNWPNAGIMQFWPRYISICGMVKKNASNWDTDQFCKKIVRPFRCLCFLGKIPVGISYIGISLLNQYGRGRLLTSG
jgi:hypothetical protein